MYNTNEQKNPNSKTEITNIMGFNTIKDLALYVDGSLGYRRDYIMFDSKYRIVNEQKNADIVSFVWGYTGGRNICIGSINSSSDIQNIVCLKLQNFCMPYGNEVYDGLSSYNRISVVIDEISAQSYIVSGNKRAHWILRHDEFYTTPATKRMEFNVEDFGNGEYWFNKPITYLDSITIKIGSPTLPITFKHDRDTCYATYGNPTIIHTTYPHLFTAYTYITLQNFITDNLQNDSAIIEQVNSKKEIRATVITANSLSIPIDTSTITPHINLLFNVFFEDRRIIMNLECTYIL